MARELPRTLKTLSADIQKNIEPEESEVIVVDHGSSKPFDEVACKQACQNVCVSFNRQYIEKLNRVVSHTCRWSK